MKYVKPQVEIVRFDENSFIATSGDEPLGNYTCGQYRQGESCNSITFPATGYSCGVYTGEGHCQSVYAPPGSMGDGCNAWKLTCTHF